MGMLEEKTGMSPVSDSSEKKKVLIAMSGGVDSSVAALLTKEQGFEVLGCTMRLFDNRAAGLEEEGSCCSLDDVDDARRVAMRIGIPFYVFNYSELFEQEVIGRFARSYCCGKTPNPCIDCNRYLKFGALMRRAAELGCDKIVTGHYARVEREESTGKYLLKKAKDPSKDQSYVLYGLTQEQLAHVLFPLGEFTKEEARQIAEAHGFINARKKDSQDICFAPDGDYAAAICRHFAREEETDEKKSLLACAFTPGDFVDREGKVLGEHRGLAHYTVGQRKGLGISADRPLYVQALDLAGNRVILGDNEDLFSRSVSVGEVHWISGEIPKEPVRCLAKIRYRHREQPCLVTAEGSRAKITFDEPQRAATPGQSAVFYDGDVVLGGGIIEKE